MSRLRSALNADGQSLVVPAAISVALHAGAVVTALLTRGLGALLVMMFPWCASEPPDIIQDSLQVAVVSLPKSTEKMPDRAARVRRPPPSPKPAPAPEPPPEKVSEVIHRTKTPPPKPGAPEDADRARADALAEMLRQEALEALEDAPEGPRDRNPTSPDGEGDEVIGSAVGAMGDPELARWHAKVKDLYRQNFNPTLDRTDLRARGRVTFDPSTGAVITSKLVERSGVLAFDMAAERALAQIRRLPVPPGGDGNSVDIEFEPTS